MIEHWVTKRIEKGKRRVFFRKEPQTVGDIAVRFSSLKVWDLYHFKAKLLPNASWFYVDVPTNAWRLTTHFNFVFDADGELSEGSFTPSGLYEDLI